jgi:quinol monooxygenase YgiN
MEPLVAATREEPGCRVFEYHRADRDTDEIIMIEVFDSPAAHEFHRRTPHMVQMQAIVRRLLGRIRLIEVVSDTVQQVDLDFIANPPGAYSPD